MVTRHCTNTPGLHNDGCNCPAEPPQQPTTSWPNRDNPCPCQSTSLGQLRRCVFYNGHAMPHNIIDTTRYTPCGHEYPGSYRCALKAGHTGIHRNLNGEPL